VTHLTVAQRERLRFVRAALDDNIKDAETREVRTVLFGCRKAIDYLLIPRPVRRGTASDLGEA